MMPRVYTLTDDWTVEYFDLNNDLYEWAASGQPVPYLPDWNFSRRYDERWAAWLTTHFSLAPILEAVCLRFELRIEAAPSPVVLYLNGRRLGLVEQFPFALDVTDFLTYEDNLLAVRVGHDSAGQFSGLRIEAHPCP